MLRLLRNGVLHRNQEDLGIMEAYKSEFIEFMPLSF